MNAPDFRRLLLLLACSLLLSPAVAAQEKEGKIKIAIIAFDGPATYGANPYMSPGYVHSPIGREVADRLAQELSKTGEFTIIDRAMADRQFVSAARAAYDLDQETLIGHGKALGIEYFVLGRVNPEFSEEAAQEPNIGMIFGGPAKVVYKKYMNVLIQFRIVNAVTAELVAANEGRGAANRKEPSPGYSPALAGLATADATREALAKLRGYASALVKPRWRVEKEQELQQKMERLSLLKSTEGRILGAAPDGSYVVSLGSDHGLALGDTLTVVGEEVLRNAKGEVIFSEEKQKGTLTITKIQTQAAITQPASGGGFAEGDKVKPDVSDVEKEVSTTFESEVSVDELLTRGRGFYNNRLHREAVPELEQARARLADTDPRAAEVAAMLGNAQFALGDMDAAIASWTWAIQRGEKMEFRAFHRHLSGNCLGQVTLSSTNFRYQSSQPDHSFDVPLQEASVSFVVDHAQVSAAPLGKKDRKKWDLFAATEEGYLGAGNVWSLLSRVMGPSRNSKSGWSGRRGSNPRHPAWEAGVLPLNYSRLIHPA